MLNCPMCKQELDKDNPDHKLALAMNRAVVERNQALIEKVTGCIPAQLKTVQ